MNVSQALFNAGGNLRAYGVCFREEESERKRKSERERQRERQRETERETEIERAGEGGRDWRG